MAHMIIKGDGSTVLGIVDSRPDFQAWVRGYTRWGDWGGYSCFTLHIGEGPAIDIVEKSDD